MGLINADQSHQIIATLMLNTKWDSIDFAESGLQDAIIRDPKGAGARFTDFLKNGANMQLPDGSNVPTTVAESSALKLVNDNVQLDAIDIFDPPGFKARQGLWFSDDFVSHLGWKVQSVKGLGAITLSSADLVRSAFDQDIKADPIMPMNPTFESESEFLAYLAQMISRQPNGEAGDLLANGSWNIFYVKHCVVRGRWDYYSRNWLFHASLLGTERWYSGRRVFALN